MLILKNTYGSVARPEADSILNNSKVYDSITVSRHIDILAIIGEFINKLKGVSQEVRTKYAAPSNPRLKNTPITLYIMVHESDLDYIDQKLQNINYFGYGSVILFTNESLPCLNSNGKLLLEMNDRLKKKDVGAGNVFKALRRYELISKDM